MSGRFTKGQTIFQACWRFASRYPQVVEQRVISRTVDSCGKKFVTFENHGRDHVFGRREFADAKTLHSTAEDAFQFLAGNPDYVKHYNTVVIYPHVVSDREWVKASI